METNAFPEDFGDSPAIEERIDWLDYAEYQQICAELEGRRLFQFTMPTAQEYWDLINSASLPSLW